MKVTLFPCGPAANESELKAFEHLKSCLQSAPGNDEWILLTNLAFSVTHQLQSDEIDICGVARPSAGSGDTNRYKRIQKGKGLAVGSVIECSWLRRSGPPILTA
jgi:hypothetical protein